MVNPEHYTVTIIEYQFPSWYRRLFGAYEYQVDLANTVKGTRTCINYGRARTKQRAEAYARAVICEDKRYLLKNTTRRVGFFTEAIDD